MILYDDKCYYMLLIDSLLLNDTKGYYVCYSLLLTQSLTHEIITLFRVYSFIHSPTHSLTHSVIHALTHS